MTSISRRNFLKATVVSAAAASVGLLGGCGSDGGDSGAVVPGPHFFPQSIGSGDPRPNSVILWARVEDASDVQGIGDRELRLQISTDAAFGDLTLDRGGFTAQSVHDYCVKVKVVDLEPKTVYYYRFLYQNSGATYASNTGRTKTAPLPDDNSPVRFGQIVCQDYVGKYYNTLAWLLEQGELDFVVHLGDYIYETTGDPTYQTGAAERSVTFSDTAGAIELGQGDQTFYAARSVSNYRELYKTYRSDAMLRRLHEQAPFIVIWDDHEYSDDCWGATSTYFRGLKDEYDVERRRNAEQVFFEYIPIDDDRITQTADYDRSESDLYPNTVIYRDFRFGKNLSLLMTDYRTYRPDHLIPEDAFPGKVVMDKQALIAYLNTLAPGTGIVAYELLKVFFGPYIDIDGPVYDGSREALLETLTQIYVQEGLEYPKAATKAAIDLSGKIGVFIYNQLAEQANAAAQQEVAPLISAEEQESLERGIAYLHLGKTTFFSEIGSRYGVVKPTFDIYAGYLYRQGLSQGISTENVWGDTQQQWLDGKIPSSGGAFLALASSMSTTSAIWDLSEETILPPEYQTSVYVNLEQWDGFPNKRRELLEALRQRGNAFIISGDIHASFVTDHSGVPDFTVSSVSSGTFKRFVTNRLYQFTADFTEEQRSRVEELLVDNLDDTLKKAFPDMVYANTNDNGFNIVTVEPDKVTTEYYTIDHAEAVNSYYDNLSALAELFTTKTFVFRNGSLVEI